MTQIRLAFQRTFVESTSTTATSSTSDDQDFSRFFSGGKQLGWQDVMACPVAVILGEAGSGKTWEFQDQVNRLNAQGQQAFFLALNKITIREGFDFALAPAGRAYAEWVASGEHGFFFLDAVDESRLLGPTALEQALHIVMDRLAPMVDRVTVCLSSRISDWQLEAVREVVARQVLPLLRQPRPAESTAQPSGSTTNEARDADAEVRAFRLAPLSREDASQLAHAHGAEPVSEFWSAVADGDYEAMATMPRDVAWLARRWATSHVLGTFSELVEDAVVQRLTEYNGSYIASGSDLSPQMRREGAECLAAASVFCNKPFIGLTVARSDPGAVVPGLILPGWDAQQQGRILGVAIFDEATFGRVKFQHRTLREYLAACWVHRRMREGLPLPAAMELFCGTSFGESVLDPGTRASFCWLATLNVRVREFMIGHHPEMLMFEGDPTVWSPTEVTEAFERYIARLAAGYRPDWWNGLGEMRRVALCIPEHVLSETLHAYPDSTRVTARVLNLIQQGRRLGCADEVFRICRELRTGSRFALYALKVLGDIATQAQRDLLRGELVRPFLGNEVEAALLDAVGMAALTVSEMRHAFQRTVEEDKYGAGPMQRLLRRTLKEADARLATDVLEALIGSLRADGLPLHATGDLHRNDHWKFRCIGSCLERVLECTAGDGANLPSSALQAALHLDALRFTPHSSDNDTRSLAGPLATKPAFRRRFAAAMASRHSTNQLVGALILGPFQLQRSDQDLELAMDLARPSNAPDVQRAGIEIALWILNDASRAKRQAVERALLDIDPALAASRREVIRAHHASIAAGRRHVRTYEASAERRKIAEDNQTAQDRERLLRNIDTLRAGNNFPILRRLVSDILDRNDGDFQAADIATIGERFGDEVASAFSEGLAGYWRIHDAPDAMQYRSNTVPWEGLLGASSLVHAHAAGLDITALDDHDIENAVRHAVWQSAPPSAWYLAMVTARPDLAVQALRPWLLDELDWTTDASTWPRTLHLLNQSPEVLLRPLITEAFGIASNRWVPNARMREQLFDAALSLGLVDHAAAEGWIVRELDAPLTVVAAPAKAESLGKWFQLDIDAAWNWVCRHSDVMRDQGPAVARCVAHALLERRHDNGPHAIAPSSTGTLQAICEFLAPHECEVPASDRLHRPARDIIEAARNKLLERLGEIPGQEAHSALKKLEASALDDLSRDWIRTFVSRHALAAWTARIHRTETSLQSLGAPYCRAPKTASELSLQVLARLEEIRDTVQNGPFSDRALMAPGMTEKKLQLWLAARLNDTPQRQFSTRFAVHREPEVDRTKRTDIEVSAGGNKVCIEIKPLDRNRYSFADLVDTLDRQLVRQYLKGGVNSRHGILVLLLLEVRGWKIPDVPPKASFEALLEALRTAAESLRRRYPHVESLQVFGIDCRAE